MRFQGIWIILPELEDIWKIWFMSVTKIWEKIEPEIIEISRTNPKYWILSISELREPILKILGILKSPEFSLSIYINEVWIAQNSKNPLLSLYNLYLSKNTVTDCHRLIFFDLQLDQVSDMAEIITFRWFWDTFSNVMSLSDKFRAPRDSVTVFLDAYEPLLWFGVRYVMIG